MADEDTLRSDIHSEAFLLPWYLNGTLREDERQVVAHHLIDCVKCRVELEELAQLQLQLKEVYAAQPSPSPHIARSVMERVRRDAETVTATKKHSTTWLEQLNSWFRLLLLPQWAPTLAATLIVAQLGVLLWVLSQPTVSEQVTTRSLGSPTTRLRVMFHAAASETQIRLVIQEANGRIVDGPTQDHAYIIEVPAGDQTAAHSKVKTMLEHRDTVQAVEIARP